MNEKERTTRKKETRKWKKSQRTLKHRKVRHRLILGERREKKLKEVSKPERERESLCVCV